MNVKWFEHVRRHHIDFTQMNSVIYRKRPGGLPVLGDDIMCGMVICTKSGGGSFEINGFHFQKPEVFSKYKPGGYFSGLQDINC